MSKLRRQKKGWSQNRRGWSNFICQKKLKTKSRFHSTCNRLISQAFNGSGHITIEIMQNKSTKLDMKFWEIYQWNRLKCLRMITHKLLYSKNILKEELNGINAYDTQDQIFIKASQLTFKRCFPRGGFNSPYVVGKIFSSD